MNQDEENTPFNRLKEIIARLRGADGCPWDKKQTHNSLKPYLIEVLLDIHRIPQNEEKMVSGVRPGN